MFGLGDTLGECFTQASNFVAHLGQTGTALVANSIKTAIQFAFAARIALAIIELTLVIAKSVVHDAGETRDLDADLRKGFRVARFGFGNAPLGGFELLLDAF